MSYQWDGGKILQRNTDFCGLRAVVGHPGVDVRTDIREWLTGSDRAELRRVLLGIADLPRTKKAGDFDKRAGLIWQWVVKNIDYVCDDSSQRLTEFYQFPAETIALKKGDCEDSAFLLASLLVASGISEYCVRAVLGTVKWNDDRVSEGHAWVIYEDESGIWRILEPTLASADLPDPEATNAWPDADTNARRGARPWYVPSLCVNQTHVWSIREIPDDDVEQFVTNFRARKAHTRENTR